VPSAWCESGLSGGLWPLRLKPYDDELLASWLVRLSRAYGMEASRFGASITHDSAFWNRDVDKGLDDNLLQSLIDRTGVPVQSMQKVPISCACKIKHLEEREGYLAK